MTDHGTVEPSQLVNLSMLSPATQQLVHSMESKILADLEKKASVERVCPNWRENVMYAFHRRDADEIGSAMADIRDARTRMDAMKEKMLAAWNRRKAVLDLYEMSLKASLQRLEEKENTVQVMSQGFFVGEKCDTEVNFNYCHQPLSPILEE